MSSRRSRLLDIRADTFLQTHSFRIVIRHAINQQRKRINPCFVRHGVCHKGETRILLRDVDALTIKRIAIFSAFCRPGKSPDIDVVIHRHFSFIAFRIGFEFLGFYFDGDIVFAIRTLLCRGVQCAIGKYGDVLKKIFDQILQIGRSLFFKSVNQRVRSGIRRSRVSVLVDHLAQRTVHSLFADHLFQVVKHHTAFAIVNVTLIGIHLQQRPL